MPLSTPDDLRDLGEPDELSALRPRLDLHPARGPWPLFVRDECFALWSGRGNRDAGRTSRLYQWDLPEGVVGPPPSTVRAWVRQENWPAWADGVPPSRDQDSRQWVTMWLRFMACHLRSVLQLQYVALQGRCGADSRAASTSRQRFLTQPGARAFVRFVFHDDTPLPPAERERLLRRRLRRVARAGRSDRRTVASAG